MTFPDIYAMQTRAIIEAACELTKSGTKVIPEIMIPLVGHYQELKVARENVVAVANTIIAKYGIKLKYSVGSMIELPRAAITADKIADYSDFFSFGTNDLTQTTFGISRDDSGKFLPFYVENEIFSDDPFVTIDSDGVGALIQIGIEKGRSTKPKLKVGICGEHGGEPKSVQFCHELGFDYVSCSPYRIPIARLAAAQAAVAKQKPKSLTPKKGKKSSI